MSDNLPQERNNLSHQSDLAKVAKDFREDNITLIQTVPADNGTFEIHHVSHEVIEIYLRERNIKKYLNLNDAIELNNSELCRNREYVSNLLKLIVEG